MAIKDRKHVRLLAIFLVIILFGLVVFFRFFLGKVSEKVLGKDIYGERIVTPDSFIDFGEEAQKDQRMNMSADIFTLGVKYFPASLPLWEALAQANESLGKIPEAIDAWQHVLDLTHPTSENLMHLASLFYRTGDYSAALQYIEKAIRLDPQPLYFEKYAQLLNVSGRYQESAEIYRNLLKQQPNNEKWQFALAWASNQPVTSSAEFLQEIHKKTLQGEAGQAKKLQEEYIFLFGLTPELQIALAENTYLQMLQQNRNDSQTWYLLANFYEKFNRFPEAEEAVKHAVAIDPRNLQYLSYFAYIKLKLAKWDEADAIYQEILALDPKSKRFQAEYQLLKMLFPLGLGSAPLSFWEIISPSPMFFETYIDWWGKRWEEVLETMPLHDGMIVNMAFDNWGEPLAPEVEKKIVLMMRALNERAKKENIKLLTKLSFGGSTYPLPDMRTAQDAEALAKKIIAVLDCFATTYDIVFDGVDLDIESKNNSADLVAHFITSLRRQLQGRRLIISLTIIGQAWEGFYKELATKKEVQDSVDYIQFMEYGGLKLHDTDLAGQIEKDILTYITPKGSVGPMPGKPGWGIPRSKVVLGLKPGEDHRQYLTPEATTQLAEFARREHLRGVMIWNTFRDAGEEWGTGQPPYTYTLRIFEVIYPQGEKK